MAKIISGKELSAKLKADMAAEVAAFPARYGRVPHLAVILVGEDPGSVSYVTGKAKASAEVGIRNTTIRRPAATDEAELLALIDELNADARNMRHIYPYPYLVAQGVLPAGLDHEQQRQFYNCFAYKVNSTYQTMTQFFNAVLADTTDTSRIRRIESQCANDLFNWTVTEVDVIETVD